MLILHLKESFLQLLTVLNYEQQKIGKHVRGIC